MSVFVCVSSFIHFICYIIYENWFIYVHKIRLLYFSISLAAFSPFVPCSFVIDGACWYGVPWLDSCTWCFPISMMTSSNGNILRVTGHLWPVDSPHKGQWREALMFSLICAETNDWASNRDAGNYLRRHRAHFNVTLMPSQGPTINLIRNKFWSIWKRIRGPCTV